MGGVTTVLHIGEAACTVYSDKTEQPGNAAAACTVAGQHKAEQSGEAVQM